MDVFILTVYFRGQADNSNNNNSCHILSTYYCIKTKYCVYIILFNPTISFRCLKNIDAL